MLGTSVLRQPITTCTPMTILSTCMVVWRSTTLTARLTGSVAGVCSTRWVRFPTMPIRCSSKVQRRIQTTSRCLIRTSVVLPSSELPPILIRDVTPSTELSAMRVVTNWVRLRVPAGCLLGTCQVHGMPTRSLGSTKRSRMC